MKEQEVRRVFLLRILAMAIPAMFPLLANAQQVREADAAMVAGCTFVGNVQGGSLWGSRDGAKEDALGDAAKLGATHLVWDNVEGVWGWVASANGKAYNCNSRSGDTASTNVTLSGNATSPAILSICAGTPIPDGYIKINDEWSSTRCGNPTTVSYNVWSLVKYIDIPTGKTLEVCADAPTPSGFVITDTQWNPTRCSHPKEKTENIKVIQRIP